MFAQKDFLMQNVSHIDRFVNLALDLKHLIVSKLINFDQASNNQLKSADQAYWNWLHLQVQNFPYWRSGHQKISILSFERKDLGRCYASCQALLVLCKNLKSKVALKYIFHAKHYLAKCYLAKLDFTECDSLLEECLAQNPKDISVIEDLAASLIAQEQFKKADSLLSACNANSLSASAQAALIFLKSKI